MISLYFADDNKSGITLGKYFFFLAHVNERMVYKILASFAELNCAEDARFKFMNHGILGLVLSILLIWLSIKYHINFPIVTLIISSVILSSKMTYFYDLLWPGKLACLGKLFC